MNPTEITFLCLALFFFSLMLIFLCALVTKSKRVGRLDRQLEYAREGIQDLKYDLKREKSNCEHARNERDTARSSLKRIKDFMATPKKGEKS